MGTAYHTICQTCRHPFTARDGGGFYFELLHCDACGEDAAVAHDDVRDDHLAMLKGLFEKRKPFLDEIGGAGWETYPGKPISGAKYRRIVEAKAGACGCGGRFTFAAPPRCPACRTPADLTVRTGMISYD